MRRQLAALLNENVRQVEIAARLGVTPSMLAGYLFRCRRRGEVAPLGWSDDSAAEAVRALEERLHFDERVRPRGCVYVVGDPKTPEWRWCGDPLATPGAPYCAAHAAHATLGASTIHY